MKLVYAFERLELVVGERTVDLLPTPGARRVFGYIVPVVRPWRIVPTGILMTLDLLLHAPRRGTALRWAWWLQSGRRSASSERTTVSSHSASSSS